MNDRRLTLVLFVLVVVVLVATAPAAIRNALERGEIYLFTTLFFSDIAPRLAGPGKLRFLIQPIVATLLGVRDGVADARAGRAPFLWSLVVAHGERRALVRSAAASIANLVLVAILLDSLFQWLIFRAVQPAAALVIGPVLISAPYAIARAVANRSAALRSQR